jgi:hypothetical protein
MSVRYVARKSERGPCNQSFVIPHPLIQTVSDLRPGIVLRHAVERFMPGRRWEIADLCRWCADRNISVIQAYGEVYREADLLEDEYATAKIFPMPWIALRFATADDAMLFKLSWPH